MLKPGPIHWNQTLLLTLAVIAIGVIPLAAQSTAINGVVRDQSGEAISGALIRLRSESTGLGFMVVSQDQGKYSTPNLLPGTYMVQAFGGTTQSGAAQQVEVAVGRQGTKDLVLDAPLLLAPRAKRLTDADYEKLIPEGGVGKAYVAGKCIDCHSLLWTVSARKTREQWITAVDRMYDDLIGRRQPMWFAIKDGEPLQGLTAPDRSVGLGTVGTPLIDYLAKNFGPDNPMDPRVASQRIFGPGAPSHPNRNLPTALLKGPAAKYMAMEFSLPSGSAPRDIAVDTQGIVWVGESNGGMLGRFDANTLTYTRIAVPAGKTPKAEVNSVAVDPQDHIWFADDGPNARIVQYNPKSGEFTSYGIPEYRFLVPDTGGARIGALRFSDGNVWATGLTSHRILKLDPSTRKITIYSAPRGAAPFGLVTADKNTVWYDAEVGNVLVKLDVTSGKLTPYEVPTPRSDLRGMASDTQGNLWAAAMESGKLVKLDPRSGKVTEFTPPTEDAGLYAIDVDAKRNVVWFSEIFADKIARFDPSNNTFVEFPHPSADSDVRRLEMDRSRPNRIWWSSTNGNKIGYLEVIE